MKYALSHYCGVVGHPLFKLIISCCPRKLFVSIKTIIYIVPSNQEVQALQGGEGRTAAAVLERIAVASSQCVLGSSTWHTG